MQLTVSRAALNRLAQRQEPGASPVAGRHGFRRKVRCRCRVAGQPGFQPQRERPLGNRPFSWTRTLGLNRPSPKVWRESAVRRGFRRSFRPRSPKVTAPTLAKPAVPGASGPAGECFSGRKWCGERNRERTFSGPYRSADLARESESSAQAIRNSYVEDIAGRRSTACMTDDG
jgi:hypothetical protein